MFDEFFVCHLGYVYKSVLVDSDVYKCSKVDTLLDWVNEEIKSLGDEQFFHKDYEETLVDTYGKDYEEDLVVEGGAVQ